MHSSDVQEPFYFYVQEPYYPYGWMVCVCVCAYQQALKFWYLMNTHFVLENKHNTDITKIWLHLLNPNLSVSQISLGWFFFFCLSIYLFGWARSYLWHVGSFSCCTGDLSSPTRDPTQAPCVEITESRHWTTREGPQISFKRGVMLSFHTSFIWNTRI